MYHASKSGQILVGHIYIYTGSFSDAIYMLSRIYLV